ncbi:hypothetical protein ACQ856_17335 [Mycolicibacterium psychrotolerans]|uniref:hypothetical protein n=1 Tax=Mycolicibacterium psychrotolerans TaxID=216929 RepID=UPI003D67F0E4
MADDNDEYVHHQEPLLPEQYEDANRALEIFNSYLLENGDGPGTKELLDDALGDGAVVAKNDAMNLVAGLLAVGAALVAPLRASGSTPQEIVDYIRTVFTPRE